MDGVETFDGGPNNSDILGETSSQYPKTLSDLWEPGAVFSTNFGPELRAKIANKVGIPDAVQLSGSFHNLFWLYHLDARLPERIEDTGSDVYLVTKVVGYLPSTDHWSLYTQGRFYHLSIITEEAGTDHDRGSRNSVRSTLKIEDLSETDLVDSSTSDKKPLLAIHMGSTQFLHSHICMIGEALIEYYSQYALLKANCQLFARSLLYRIVMTAREESVFVGSKVQLVNWTRVRRATPNGAWNSRKDGFELIKPKRDGTSHLSDKSFSSTSKQITYWSERAQAIAHLYTSGKSSVNFHRTDETTQQSTWATCRSITRDVSREIRDIVQQSRQEHAGLLGRALSETYEDARAGRWKDVLTGREQFRNELKDIDHRAQAQQEARERFGVERLS